MKLMARRIHVHVAGWGAAWWLSWVGLLVLSACGPVKQEKTGGLSRLDAEREHRLDNGQVALVISPRTGRVSSFGYSGGRNLLWALSADAPRDGTYVNYGGDKLWPTLQAIWPRAFGRASEWPPDGIIDGKPWTVIEASPTRVVMESSLNPALGVRARRQFELIDHQPAVRITNTLMREQANVFPVMIWTVTQVHHPLGVLLGIEPDRPSPHATWIGLVGQSIDDPHVKLFANNRAAYKQVQRDGPVTKWKIGTLGGWVAAIYIDVVFIQRTRFDPRGCYPDASSVQAYGDASYVELELLGPMVHLRQGESLSNVITWQLVPRGDESIQELAERLAR